jgi:hypothetical protein
LAGNYAVCKSSAGLLPLGVHGQVRHRAQIETLQSDELDIQNGLTNTVDAKSKPNYGK